MTDDPISIALGRLKSIEELETLCDQQRADIKDLITRYETLQPEYVKTLDALQRLRKEHERLQKEMAGVQMANNVLMSNYDRVEKQRDELAFENSSLRVQIGEALRLRDSAYAALRDWEENRGIDYFTTVNLR